MKSLSQKFNCLLFRKGAVRDLVDSLYQGYPTGYLIISKSPDLKLKDGSLSVGKKIKSGLKIFL